MSPAQSAPLPSKDARPGPVLVPCLLLRRGQVCLPGAEGPTVARTADGVPFDPFDVVDRLSPDYSLLYVVDLDGIERGDAQLDYLQEISRDMTLWVDAGVRTADQAIDILVAGASRAVLSNAYLEGPRQLRRAWRLSTELVFELEVEGSSLAGGPGDWETTSPTELAGTVRAAGPDQLVVSFRGVDPDWSLVRSLTAGGPTWVDGTFARAQARRLTEVGAAGGIFHLDEILGHPEA